MTEPIKNHIEKLFNNKTLMKMEDKLAEDVIINALRNIFEDDFRSATEVPPGAVIPNNVNKPLILECRQYIKERFKEIKK